MATHTFAKATRIGIVVLAVVLMLSVLVACNGTTQYTVTFYTAEGQVYNTITVNASTDSITLPTAPTREGYTFEGWYLDNGTWNNAFEAGAVSSDISVYAKWKQNATDTPDNPDNPTDKTLSSIAVTYSGKDVLTIGKDSVETDKIAVTATYSDNSTAAISIADVTLVGLDATTAGEATITVRYQGKEASFKVTLINPNATLNSIAVTYTGKTRLQLNEDIERDKIAVVATYSDSTTAAITDYTVAEFVRAAGEVTVTVTYEGKSDTFNVTYMHASDLGLTIDGFTAQEDSLSATVPNATESMDFAAIITVDSYSAYTVAIDAEGTEILESAAQLKEGDNTYYVTVKSTDDSTKTYTVKVYRKHMYNVTFAWSNTTDFVRVEEGQTAEPLATEPDIVGYDFDGWDFDFDTPITADVVIESKWVRSTYEITFDMDGGTPAQASVTATYGLNLPALDTVPAKDGYTFQGYYYNDECCYSDSLSHGSWNNDFGAELKAKWLANNYTIGFENSDYQICVDFGYEMPLLGDDFVMPTAPIEGAYDFKGYAYNGVMYYVYGEEELEPAHIWDVPEQNIILMEVWEGKTFTATLRLSGGQLTEGAATDYTYQFGSAIGQLPVPTRTGYTFGGWYDNAAYMYAGKQVADENGQGGQNVYDYTIDYVFFAKWTANTYTVTLHISDGSVSSDTVEVTYDDDAYKFPVGKFNSAIITFGGWWYKDATPSLQYTDVDGNATRVWDIPHDVELTAFWNYQTFTITFDMDGGTVANESGEQEALQVMYSKPYPALSLKPSKVGYTFQGYYEKESSSTIYNSDLDAAILSYVFNRNIEVVAVWEPISVQVSFDRNGGEGVEIGNKETFFGYAMNSIDPSNLPTRYGYIFTGYYDAKEGGKKYYNADGTSACLSDLLVDTELFAQWSDTVYFVKFNANNNKATGTMSDMQCELGATYNLAANAFAVTGYAFNGWNTQADGEGTDVANGQSIKDVVGKGQTYNLYAKWKAITYTITYDLGDGEGEQTLQVDFDAAYNLPVPKKTGYDFNGWYYNGTQYTESNGVARVVYQVAGDITVTADWTAHEWEITLYTYDGNTFATAKVVYDRPLPTLPAGLPTRTGYDFDGFYFAADGNDIYYDNEKVAKKDAWTVDEGHDLYAHWMAKEFNITFVNGVYGGPLGTGTQEGITVAFDSKPADIEIVISCTGYEFLGYYLEDTKYFNADGTFALERWSYIYGNNTNYTLAAHWDLGKYTVTLDVNGGDALPVEQQSYKVTYNDWNVVFPIPTYTDGFYTFDGWFDKEGKQYGYANGGIATYVTEDVTIYAKWIARKVTLSFDANGGNDLSMGYIAPVAYNSEMPDIGVAATRTGYDFQGYFDAAEGGKKYYNADLTHPEGATLCDFKTSNVTLYAQWQAKKVNLNFNLEYGTLATDDGTYGTVTATYGQAMPAISPKPTKENYNFKGYWLQGTIETYYYDEDLASVRNWDRDVSEPWLIAKWQLATYTVKFDANGGEGSMDDVVWNRAQSNNMPACAFSREGYLFVGWVDDEDNNYTAGSTYSNVGPANGEITLYAKWEADTIDVNLKNSAKTTNVYFDLNDYDGVAPDTQAVSAINGLEYVMPSPNAEYYFIGWYDNDTYSGSEYDFSKDIASPLTLYAKYYALDFAYSDHAMLNFSSENTITVTKAEKYYTFYALTSCRVNITVGKTAWISVKQVGEDSGSGANSSVSFSVKKGDIVRFSISSNSGLETEDYTGSTTLCITPEQLPAAGGKGSNQYGTKSVEFDAAAGVALGVPTRTGYIFSGWYTQDNGKGAKVAGSDGKTLEQWKYAEAIDLYAYWQHQSEVTFDLGAGTGTITPDGFTATTDEALPDLTIALTPTAGDEYEFIGLFDAATDGTKYYNKNGKATRLWDKEDDDVTLYAQYYLRTYVVSFDKNADDAIGSPANQAIYRTQATALDSNSYTRTGYKFLGWNTKADGSGTHYDDGETVTNLTIADGNIILYAEWEIWRTLVTVRDETQYYNVTITFDMNGAIGDAPAAQEVTPSKGATYPIPAWAGHLFSGWYTDEACTKRCDMSSSFSSDITLYAGWIEAKYGEEDCIVLDINKDTAINITEDAVYYEFYNHVYGAITISADHPLRFSSFANNYLNCTLVEGEGSIWSYTMNNCIRTNFSLSIQANGYTGAATLRITATAPQEGGVSVSHVVERKVVTFGEEFSFTTTTPADATHYDFLGYGYYPDDKSATCTDADGNGLDTWFEQKDTRNVYAVIRGKKSVITFDYQNNTTPDAYYDAYYGEVFTHPSGTPNRSGYNFKGFYTEKNGGGVQRLSNAMVTVGGSDWLEIEDTTLYAYWTPKSYVATLQGITKSSVTITFNLNGGESGCPDPIELDVGDTLSVPDATPVRAGYTFLCWSTNANSGSYDFSQTLSNNVTLYARWSGSSYPILFAGDTNISVSSLSREFYVFCAADGDITITVEKNAHISNWAGTIEGDGSITLENCKGGVSYGITIRSYNQSSAAEYTGTAKLTVTAPSIPEGGTVSEGLALPVTHLMVYDSDDFDLPVPVSDSGKTFVGWQRWNGAGYILYTDSEGHGIRAWDYSGDAPLSACWE